MSEEQDLPLVELHPAYRWDCDECGRENFDRGIHPDLTAEEEADLRERFGVEPWEEGEFEMAPTQVVCSHCLAEFATIARGQEGL